MNRESSIVNASPTEILGGVNGERLSGAGNKTTMNNIIYHITTKAEWEEANKNGFYEAASLPVEGFIHCSDAHQVAGVLKRYFLGKGPLVKLTIDTNKLHCRFQYDYSPSMNEAFPHIYGRVNLDAIVAEVNI